MIKLSANKAHQVWVSTQGRVPGACAVCAGPIFADAFHVGHIIAESKGGDDTISNLTTQCMSCNTSMKDMDLLEYAQKRFGVNSPEDNRVTQLLKKKEVYEKVLQARASSAMTPGGPPRDDSTSDGWDAKIQAAEKEEKAAIFHANDAKVARTLVKTYEKAVLKNAAATEADKLAAKDRVGDAKRVCAEVNKKVKECTKRKEAAMSAKAAVVSAKAVEPTKMSGSAGRFAVPDTKFEKNDVLEVIEDFICAGLDPATAIQHRVEDIKVAPLIEGKLCCRSMGEKLHAAEARLHHVEEKIRNIEAQHAEEMYILKQSLGLVIFMFLVCAAGGCYLYSLGQ